jgi:phytoene dehydrogenase-like protein
MSESVAIVGGGFGGLATAALLARDGIPVTVFERSRQLGGRAASQQIGSAWFNQGPHALYRHGPAMEVLDQLGVPYSGKTPATSGNWAVRGGELFPLPATALSLLSSPLLTWAERADVARFLVRLHLRKTTGLDEIPLEVILSRELPGAGARSFVQALTRVSSYTNAPAQMSAGAALDQLRAALRHNVLYLDGGWQSLVEGLRSVAEKAGARIMAAAHVGGIHCDAGGVRGLRVDGEYIPSSTVVLAVSPRVASGLVEGGSMALSRIAAGARPVHAACLDVALGRLPMPTRTFALGIDQPLYFSVHTKYAQLGPSDVHVLHVAKYLPPDEDGVNARGELEALVDVMQPGWRDHLIDQRFMPRLVVMPALPLASLGGTRGRPPTSVLGIAGLHVVGDWVGPERMLADAVFSSASRAARDIMTSRSSQQVNALPPERGRRVA